MKAHKITALGVSYVPQGRHIFPRLTVLENLSVPVTKGKVEDASLEEVFGYFPVLKERLAQLGGTLSGGQQQMLAIGRALMSKPKLIVFDEPTEGLQPSIVQQVRQTIKILRDKGITALIADQNLENALELCDRVYVLEKGTIKYTEQKERLSLDLLRVLPGRHQETGRRRRGIKCIGRHTGLCEALTRPSNTWGVFRGKRASSPGGRTSSSSFAKRMKERA